MDKQGCIHDWYLSWKKGQLLHSARCINCDERRHVDLDRATANYSERIVSIEALINGQS